MDGRSPQMKRLRNLVIGRPLRRAQQHVGACHLARGRFAFVNQAEQVPLLLFSQVNEVFVGHGDSSC